jgi:hypothetical protein
LSPDYSLTKQEDRRIVDVKSDLDGLYNPQPLDTRGVNINQSLDQAIGKFAEHFHDVWALKKVGFIKLYTVKPVHAVTSIKQSPVLKDHFFIVPKMTF